jgi:hypothetical protein
MAVESGKAENAWPSTLVTRWPYNVDIKTNEISGLEAIIACEFE